MEIKTVLQDEIEKGLVNWDKMEPKFAAVISNLQHGNIATDDNGNKVPVEDAVTFKINNPLGSNCIKLIGLRLRNGKLHCNGIQRGFYNPQTGKPAFPIQPMMFEAV